MLPARWIISCIALSALAVTFLMARAELTIGISGVTGGAILFGMGSALALHYRFRRPRRTWQRVIRDAIEYLLLFASVCLIGALASYAVAATSSGFADRSLAMLDHMMGFDWPAWYGFEVDHPRLEPLTRAAYQSIFLTPALLLGYFAVTGRKAEARRFIAAFWLAALVTLLLFMRYPAEGPLAFLWHGPIPYMPESAMDQVALIPALRLHAVHHVPLLGLRGLVGAPSFHTVSAILYIAAAWPVARLRWPVLALNLAMLLAVPVEGTHYLADMIAGVLVAIGALVVVARLAALPSAAAPER